ncbi:hypothetical protein J7I97_37965 [Streptomyces sp. ISL-87]|nr:hypothetical protein [Streptomyces sp. ISL-87]
MILSWRPSLGEQTMGFVLALDDAGATLETAGGKGAALSELARGGLPVPGGFHVTTAAYQEFVTSTGVADRIRTVVGHGRGPARPVLRRPAGHVPEHHRPERPADSGPPLLGVPVDRPRHRLPRPGRHRARGRFARRGGAGTGGRRCRRGDVHGRPARRACGPARRQRRLGTRRGRRQRAGHPRHPPGRPYEPGRRGGTYRREGGHDRTDCRRHRGAAGPGRPARSPGPQRTGGR